MLVCLTFFGGEHIWNLNVIYVCYFCLILNAVFRNYVIRFYCWKTFCMAVTLGTTSPDHNNSG